MPAYQHAQSKEASSQTYIEVDRKGTEGGRRSEGVGAWEIVTVWVQWLKSLWSYRIILY